MTFVVNTAKIKRQAHALTRNDTNSSNVFRHLWTKRSQTWDVENGNGDNDGGSPIEHASTAPHPSTKRSLDGSPTSDEKQFGYRDPQEKDFASGSRTDSNPDTVVPSQNSTAAAAAGAVGVTDSGLTNRRPNNGVNHSALPDASAAADEEEDGEKKKEKKKHRFYTDIKPREPFTIVNQLQRTFLNSWINILLLAVPVGIGLGATNTVNKVAIFVINFIAIIPLAAMLSFATEEIALRTGETIGGLLNASFGNAVELIVAVIALKNNEIAIVQTSLIGSILSNLLLVLGMCFFFGGLRRQEQYFNTTVAQTAASILALAIAGLIIPRVFDIQTSVGVKEIAALSRGTCMILLFVYGCYLVFQLKTHHAVFSAESQKVAKKPRKKDVRNGAVQAGLAQGGGINAVPGAPKESHDELSRSALDRSQNGQQGDHDDDDEEHEYPQLSFPVAVATLVGVTVLIAFCAEFLVDAIDAVAGPSSGMSKEFLGLILLPIVGNAAEHATAVTVAIKDKMDLAIGVAVGSSMQVALFIIPLLVVIGWGMGIDDMNLSFDTFQVAVLFVSVLLVNYLIGDGKSHWLEGMLLMCLYLIIAVCAWYYPVNPDGTVSSTTT